MVLTSFQGLGLGVCAYLLWRTIVRPFVRTSPLDELPGPPAQSFFTGNLFRYVSRDADAFHHEISQNCGPVVNMKGLFGQPALYIYDPKALHHIVLKDQYIYEENPLFTSMTSLFFGPGLLATSGDLHKRQRKMLNPVFSIAHMRNLLPIFYDVTGKLRKAIEARVANGPIELDMAEWVGRAALELIGQAGFGTSFDPLVEDTKDAYAVALKAIPGITVDLGLLMFLIPALSNLGPPALRRTLVKFVPSRKVQKMRTLIDIMHRRSVEIYREKKAALEKGEDVLSTKGKDIMSILIKANMEATEEDRLPEHEVIAQVSTFSFAGTDTTSNILSRILWLLATHLDAQQRLREEVSQVQVEQGDLAYDKLMALPYLDAVCRETLRLFPLTPFLSRMTTQDMILPLSEPVRTKKGQDLMELPIEKGTEVFLGITGWNTNKAAWGEDALEWKPERWMQPLPATVTDAHVPAVYSNIMTFIGGSKACIGFKFAEMEMKVILATLLPRFTFALADKEIFWNYAAVRYPSVGSYNQKNEMPLKVGLYEPAG